MTGNFLTAVFVFAFLAISHHYDAPASMWGYIALSFVATMLALMLRFETFVSQTPRSHAIVYYPFSIISCATLGTGAVLIVLVIVEAISGGDYSPRIVGTIFAALVGLGVFIITTIAKAKAPSRRVVRHHA